MALCRRFALSILEKLIRSCCVMFGSWLGNGFLYLFLALTLWVVLYGVYRARFRHRRIAARDPTAAQLKRELLHSLRSIGIFGVVTGAVIYAGYSGMTRLYLRIDDYGWVWFVASVGLMILMHDTYFYWTHRWMHHRRVYRWVHATHHRSISPTPWAAYAFGPIEALIQAGIGPLIVFTIPVHPAAFAIFMTWQIAFNVFGHCGYEIFPAWFLRSPLAVVFNSVTHHALHHEKYRSNFGLYFNLWDRCMGSNHVEYELRFQAATAAPTMTADSAK